MVKDAESHADEDKKTVELVAARNQADALIHSIKKSMTEYGDTAVPPIAEMDIKAARLAGLLPIPE